MLIFYFCRRICFTEFGFIEVYLATIPRYFYQPYLPDCINYYSNFSDGFEFRLFAVSRNFFRFFVWCMKWIVFIVISIAWTVILVNIKNAEAEVKFFEKNEK